MIKVHMPESFAVLRPVIWTIQSGTNFGAVLLAMPIIHRSTFLNSKSTLKSWKLHLKFYVGLQLLATYACSKA